MSPPEQVVAHVVTLKAEEVEAPAAEGAVAATPAEPEVIKKGKKEEDEAEAEKRKGEEEVVGAGDSGIRVRESRNTGNPSALTGVLNSLYSGSSNPEFHV